MRCCAIASSEMDCAAAVEVARIEAAPRAQSVTRRRWGRCVIPRTPVVRWQYAEWPLRTLGEWRRLQLAFDAVRFAAESALRDDARLAMPDGRLRNLDEGTPPP